MKVQLFYKQHCLPCKIVERFFVQQNIPFEKIECDWRSTPFLKIDGVVVEGPFTTRRLKRLKGLLTNGMQIM